MSNIRKVATPYKLWVSSGDSISHSTPPTHPVDDEGKHTPGGGDGDLTPTTG
jgi:hypothetical protein